MRDYSIIPQKRFWNQRLEHTISRIHGKKKYICPQKGEQKLGEKL